MGKTYNRTLGSGSYIGKGAKKVSDWAGGSGLTDYAGGRGSKRGAVESGLKVAKTMGNVALLGLGGAGKKVAGRGIAKVKKAWNMARTGTAKGITKPGRGSTINKANKWTDWGNK
jgi:hypothetical protein